MSYYLFTSESVSEGHPDKVADQISDSILDGILAQDKYARVAAETLVNTGLVVLAGEISTSASINYTQIVRDVIRDIGYTKNEYGFAADSCAIMVNYDEQSPDIALGVNEGQGFDIEQGAGDQGLMFGYAVDETPKLMPFPIYYSHRLMEQQAKLRKSSKLAWLRPDAKAQLTVKYDCDTGRPFAIDTVVLSTQHDPDISYTDLREAVIEEIIKPILPSDMLVYNTKYFLNLYKNVKTAKLSPSFEYNKQAQIVVPRFTYSPEYKTRNDFTKELSNYLATKVINYDDGYGTLVLFFNRIQLQEVYSLLPKQLQKKILLQTDFISNQKLITEHKKNIDNGYSSIIFGLNSFAEGVDLPLLYCVHLVITKLPFETHKNPLNMVQEYWVTFEKSSYFIEVSLPETCIKLIQASGRLIRGEDDYGQLTICDNRIINKAYGGFLLNCLPEFNRNYDKDFICSAYRKLKLLSL